MIRNLYVRCVIAFVLAIAATALVLAQDDSSNDAASQSASPPRAQDGDPAAEASGAATTSKDKRLSTAFAMKQTRTFTPTEGAPFKRASIERHQRSDGAFLEVTTHYDAQGEVRGTSVRLGIPERGIFRADDKRRVLELIAPFTDEELTEDPEALLRRSDGVVREDSVSGYRTLVLRDPQSTAKEHTEWHHVPELDGAIVKSITVTREGSEVVEPTEIRVGDGDRKLFDVLRGYATDVAAYERRIAWLEARGHSSLTTGMREQVRRAKQPRN